MPAVPNPHHYRAKRNRRVKWRKGKIHNRKGYGRGRWIYPNGKKKGRRWKKV